MKVKDLRPILEALDDNVEVIIRNHHLEDKSIIRAMIDITPTLKGNLTLGRLTLRLEEEKL